MPRPKKQEQEQKIETNNPTFSTAYSNDEKDKKIELLIEDNIEAKEEKEKKPRGKAAKQLREEAEAKDFVNAVSGIGEVIMNMIVQRLPDPRPLSDMEKEQINKTFDRVVYKYTAILGDWKEEVAFITVCSLIILPRTKILNPKVKDNGKP